MRVLQRGHRYELKNRGDSSTGSQTIQYVNREPGMECDGVTQQEVLRMMLDHNRYCTSCLPNSVSERIQYHLRMALVLHEMRALERKVQKGELAPEFIDLGKDGHFRITDYDRSEIDGDEELETDFLKPYKHEWEQECNHQTVNDQNTPDLSDIINDTGDPEEVRPLSKTKKPKPPTSKLSKKAIYDDRLDLDAYLKRGSANGIKADVNGSVKAIMDRVRKHDPRQADKAEELAKFCYAMFCKRVGGSKKPAWGSVLLRSDSYFSGYRARAYIEGLELALDYQEIGAHFFTDKKDTAIIRKPVILINTKTGSFSRIKWLDFSIVGRTNGIADCVEIVDEGMDDTIELEFLNKHKKVHRLFLGLAT